MALPCVSYPCRGMLQQTGRDSGVRLRAAVAVQPICGVGRQPIGTLLLNNSKQQSRAILKQSKVVDDLVQALEQVSKYRGMSQVLKEFESRLTLQDMKQLFLSFGTEPEKNWAKAMKLFHRLHDLKDYKPDYEIFHTILVLLGKAKRLDIAEALLERMKEESLQPRLQEYEALIHGHVKNGNLDKGIAILKLMKDSGVKPSVSVYNALIDGCVRGSKRVTIATDLVEQMRNDNLLPDTVTYTALMVLFSRKGRHTEAIHMFQEMQLRGCRPDSYSYNSVLNAYSKLGKTKEMMQVHKMMVEQEVEPSIVTFNILLNALGRVGRIKDVCHIFQLMRKSQVIPDVATCAILVNAYGKAEAWGEMDMLLSEMESLGLQPDLTVYNSLISIYGKARRFEQVDLIIKSLTESNMFQLDLITYNTLLDVYGKAGRLSDVVKWFAQMRKQCVKPDVKTFNALVHAYGRASQYDGVKKVWELFSENGNQPDLVFYHTLLFMFGKGGQFDDAWHVIKDMKKAGYVPSLDIYNALILVFGRTNAQEAVRLLQDMIAENVKPNSATYKSLIEVHARRGLADECWKFFRESTEQGLDDSFLSVMCGALCNMKQTDEAETLLMEQEEHGQSPSVGCYNWLILGYGRMGLWEKAEKVVETMKSKNLILNAQSYGFLLEAYGLAGLYTKGADIASKLLDSFLTNNISANNALIRFYVRSGDISSAIEVYNALKGCTIKPNCGTYSALIPGYGRGDMPMDAKILASLKDLKIYRLEPNYGIFTALLSAISRCKTQGEAQQLVGFLEQLGCPQEVCCLFKEEDMTDAEAKWANLEFSFRAIDRSGYTQDLQGSFHNAFVEALWWFGWETRALRVMEISLEHGIYRNFSTWDEHEWSLDLHSTSAGSAQLLLLMWVASMRAAVLRGEDTPTNVKIIFGKGCLLQSVENRITTYVVQAHLQDLGFPYRIGEDPSVINLSGKEVHERLKQESLEKLLFLIESSSQTRTAN